MRKKIVAILMAAAMIISMLAGCANTETPKGTDAQTGAPTAGEAVKETDKPEETEKKPDPETVIWWVPGTEAEDHDLVMEELNKILVEKINVKLDLVRIDTGFADRVKLASTSGEEFDLVWTSNYSNKFDENLAREGFMAIEDIVAEYGQDLVATLPEGLLDVATVDGHLYAIPNLQILARQLGVYVMKDYAEKYNLELTHIDDISELYPFLDQIVANEPNVYALTSSGVSPTNEAVYESLANGAVFVRKDDTGLNAISNAEATAANLRARNEWYQRGYIQEDIVTATDISAGMKAGKYVCQVAVYKPGGAEERSINHGIEYICIPIGEPYIQAASGQETMTAVNVNSKHPEAAIKLLNLLFTDKEVFNMLLYGIEGVHYNKIDETHAQKVENTKYNYSGQAWRLGNQFLAYYSPTQVDGTWEATAEMNRTAQVSPMRGFVFDATNVQAELAQISAVTKEYSDALAYVAEDIEAYIAERAAKLETAGLSKVVAEVQAQLDAWKAAK